MDLNQLLENDKEWRKFMLLEIREMRKEITSLKVKLGIVSTVFGLIGGSLGAVAKKFL